MIYFYPKMKLHFIIFNYIKRIHYNYFENIVSILLIILKLYIDLYECIVLV